MIPTKICREHIFLNTGDSLKNIFEICYLLAYEENIIFVILSTVFTVISRNDISIKEANKSFTIYQLLFLCDALSRFQIIIITLYTS